jgi:plasmid stabilization system protein ParE
MRFEFSPEAKAEFEDGERYYKRQFCELGVRFRADIKDALARLRHWPLAAPVERGDIRRMILSRFPYKLLYSVEGDCIYIIALAHLHRAPDYWIGRGKQ